MCLSFKASTNDTSSQNHLHVASPTYNPIPRPDFCQGLTCASQRHEHQEQPIQSMDVENQAVLDAES